MRGTINRNEIARESTSRLEAGKRMKLMLCGVVLALATQMAGAITIPSGTALPVSLNSSISSNNSRPGQVLKARVMQDVPLTDGQTIRAGSTVTGHVVNNPAAGARNGTRVSFEFDTLTLSKSEPLLSSFLYHSLFDRKPKQTTTITAHLRTLASPMEVIGAERPTAPIDEETPATTVLVGGDVVYWGGGPVTNQASEVVGKPVYGGVLSDLEANPSRGCGAGGDRPQALWVFSADACGSYGLGDVTIANSNRVPAEEITLTTDQETLKVGSGTGMLLVVDGNK
jgi:hypothetical protein